VTATSIPSGVGDFFFDQMTVRTVGRDHVVESGEAPKGERAGFARFLVDPLLRASRDRGSTGSASGHDLIAAFVNGYASGLESREDHLGPFLRSALTVSAGGFGSISAVRARALEQAEGK
jgi:hypothetical protein